MTLPTTTTPTLLSVSTRRGRGRERGHVTMVCSRKGKVVRIGVVLIPR